MLRLTARQREALIQKAPDAGNLAAGSMLLGQFLVERPFSVALAIAGATVWLVSWGVMLVLAQDERR
jgi:hypothetical protein